MSIYKKIASNQKISNSPPTTHSHEQNQWGVFLSKLHYGFMSVVVFMLHGFGFLAPPRVVSRGVGKIQIPHMSS